MAHEVFSPEDVVYSKEGGRRGIIVEVGVEYSNDCLVRWDSKKPGCSFFHAWQYCHYLTKEKPRTTFMVGDRVRVCLYWGTIEKLVDDDSAWVRLDYEKYPAALYLLKDLTLEGA